MVPSNLAKRASRVLAASLLLSLVGVPELLADVAPAVSSETATLLVFVALPLALAATVLVRALTREPAGVFLVVFATPCVLAGALAAYEYACSSPGVVWGPLFTLASGALLAVFVLADAVIEQYVRSRGTRDARLSY